MIKIILCCFLLMVANLSGWAQIATVREKKITLTPNKEEIVPILFSPKIGAGREIKVPTVVSWGKESGLIKVEFKADGGNRDKSIYSFPKLMFCKDVMKERKEVWFDKSMTNKKSNKSKIVQERIINMQNVTCEGANNAIRMLDLNNSQGALSFFFTLNKTNLEEDCEIHFVLYVAATEKKKKRTHKIEYQTQFILTLSLQDIVELPPVEPPPVEPSPVEPPPVNEPVEVPEKNLCDDDLLATILKYLSSEIDSMYFQYISIDNSIDNLHYFSCTSINELTEIIPDNRERVKQLHPRYNKYNDCVNLKEKIQDHNDAVDERNYKIEEYNAELRALKDKCNASAQSKPQAVSQASISCSLLEQVNKDLFKLMLKIKNGDKSHLPNYKVEFEQTIRTVEDPGYKKCKNYDAFKSLHANIEELLKQ